MLILSLHISQAAPTPLGVNGYITGPGSTGADVIITVYDGAAIDDQVTATTDGSGYYVNVSTVSDGVGIVDINVFANNTVGMTVNATAWRYNYAVAGGAIEMNLTMSTALYPTAPVNQTTINDTMPVFSWYGFNNASYTFNLLIDNDANFNLPVYRTISGIDELNHTLNSSTALVDDTYYWRIDEYIDSVYSRSAGVSVLDIDSTPPTVDSYNPGNYSWSGTTPVAAIVTTNEDSECKYDTNPGVPYATKTTTMTGVATSHNSNMTLSAQGNNIFYLQCTDTVGNTMTGEKPYFLRYDSAAPTPGTVTVEGGDYYHGSTTVNFVWSGYNDSTSGINMYYFGFTNNQGTSTSDGFGGASPGILAGAGQGSVTIYVWARDNVGNIGLAASDSIVVDSQDPVLYDWNMTPADVDAGTSGVVNVRVRVNDTTWNNSLLRIRYQYNNNGWYAYQNMTLVAGNQYSFDIPEPGTTWSSYTNDWLHYQVEGTDMLGNIVSTLRSEFIEIFNNAPVFDAISNQVIAEDQNLSIVISATDLDGDTLTFVSSHNFTFTRLTASSVLAWWVPDNNDIGSPSVEFNVTDGIDTDTTTITVDVGATNDVPILYPIGNLQAYLHKPFKHFIFGWDPDNKNANLLDNNLLIFDKTQNYRWFRMNSFFNVSNESYYGVVNFTPLLSHRGSWNMTVYVTDGTAVDSENITFTVGYCGDEDAGEEPWCDEDYESCVSCSSDCGECGDDEGKYLTIIIDPRNCLDRNFTIWTYTLWDRASCPDEGLIVEGMEVCGNISTVKLEGFLLVKNRWEKIDEYISDENGETTFVATTVGEYKLVGTKRGYPTAYEYLEIRPCIVDEEEVEKTKPKVNETEELPKEEKPKPTEPQEEKGEIIPEASTTNVIISYVVIPTILIICIVFGYYFYDRNKEKNVLILKSRIWFVTAFRKSKKWVKESWKKLKAYLGSD